MTYCLTKLIKLDREKNKNKNKKQEQWNRVSLLGWQKYHVPKMCNTFIPHNKIKTIYVMDLFGYKIGTSHWSMWIIWTKMPKFNLRDHKLRRHLDGYLDMFKTCYWLSLPLNNIALLAIDMNQNPTSTHLSSLTPLTLHVSFAHC